MRSISFVVSLAFMLSLAHAVASQTVPPKPQSQHDQILIQLIQAGDGAAMNEAGRSGNRLFIPFLREQLKNRDKHVDRVGPARFALARLGETDQLQEVWCSASSGDPVENGAAVLNLGLIGGWFGIRGLEIFLTPEGQRHFLTTPTKHRDARDNALLPPMYYALKALPGAVPHPPVQFDDTQMKQQTKIWQDWIPAHKDELSKLQPTGEGVDFSDTACKDGKARKK
jgi:hypothetical protein